MELNEVIIQNISPSRMLEIVYELRQQGKKPNVDFLFSYIPASIETPRHGKFLFYDEAYTSWFVMRYL
jgi:hypothetical protein